MGQSHVPVQQTSAQTQPSENEAYHVFSKSEVINKSVFLWLKNLVFVYKCECPRAFVDRSGGSSMMKAHLFQLN